MKILQIISHYVPAISFGGPLHVAHGLGRAMVEHGHEVTVCCTNMREPSGNLDEPLDQPVTVDGVRVFYERVRGLRHWGFSTDLAWRVFHEARCADLVITHFHYQFASVIGGWCARLFGKPHVVFTHGSLNRHGLQARRSTIKLVYLRLLESGNFRKALFVAYNSPGELDQSLRFGTSNLVVPSGIDVDVFEDGPGRGEFRARYPGIGGRFLFLYMGRLAPGKGLDILLRSISSVLSAHSNVQLVIAGGDERGYIGSLRQQVEHLNLTERVLFTGILDGRMKLAALTDADVFVLPSRSEGTSIVTFEAMAMRLPVIITDRVGQWREVVSSRCGKVVAYDTHELGKAMIEMIETNDRADMGERGRKLVRVNCDWNVIAKGFLERVELVGGAS